MDLEVNYLFDANSVKANHAQKEFKAFFDVEDEHNRKRNQVFLELCITEISFLLQLELLLKFFYFPLKSSEILAEVSFEALFGNVTQLYNVNRELLGLIRENTENISRAFITFGPYLKLYSFYAYGYKKALIVLEELKKKNKKFNEFVRNQETRPEVSCTIISLLIAPIQRIPRYRLLFQSLLESTLTDHPHRSELQEALSLIEETAEHINRLITESEENEMMVKLAQRFGSKGGYLVIPGRKILKEGLVRKSSKNGTNSQQRYLVLFTDAVLIARGKMKGALTDPQLLPLRHLNIETVLGSSLFQLTCENDKFLLYTTVPEDGKSWTDAIKTAIYNHALCRRTLRKDSSKRNVKHHRLKRVAENILKRARSCKADTCLKKLKRLGSKDN